MQLEDRVEIHAALGERHRLMIVDALGFNDLTFTELAAVTGLRGNALAYHLATLEDVGIVTRRVSEGDRRRRYLRLDTAVVGQLLPAPPPPSDGVVFVCTHNSARSQFAAACWESRTGSAAGSAGAEPSATVNPMAIDVAVEFGLDLSVATPQGYDSLGASVGTMISVCDRAREGDLPPAQRHLHWSTPDPVPLGTRDAFRAAFSDLAARIDRLAAAGSVS